MAISKVLRCDCRNMIVYQLHDSTTSYFYEWMLKSIYAYTLGDVEEAELLNILTKLILRFKIKTKHEDTSCLTNACETLANHLGTTHLPQHIKE